jgi:hypothetical protein
VVTHEASDSVTVFSVETRRRHHQHRESPGAEAAATSAAAMNR